MGDNVIPFRPPAKFTPQAQKRWAEIPTTAQKRILQNVWCSECRDGVTIVLETANMERGDVILRGKCKTCGGEVCRVVEGEN